MYKLSVNKSLLSEEPPDLAEDIDNDTTQMAMKTLQDYLEESDKDIFNETLSSYTNQFDYYNEDYSEDSFASSLRDYDAVSSYNFSGLQVCTHIWQMVKWSQSSAYLRRFNKFKQFKIHFLQVEPLNQLPQAWDSQRQFLTQVIIILINKY